MALDARMESETIELPDVSLEISREERIGTPAAVSELKIRQNCDVEDFRMADGGTFHARADVIAYSSTPSDERLKDNVVTIDSGLSLVNQLRGVTFDWNQGSKQGTRDIGVIAQEVEKVLPELVKETKLPLLTDSDEVYKTVDYEKLTAVLIEAVKELSQKVEHIEKNCDCLKD